MVLALPIRPSVIPSPSPSPRKINIINSSSSSSSNSSPQPGANLTRFREKLRTYTHQSRVLPSHLARVLSCSPEEYDRKLNAANHTSFFSIEEVAALIRYLAVRKAFWTLEEKVELFTLAYSAPLNTAKVGWVTSWLSAASASANASVPLNSAAVKIKKGELELELELELVGKPARSTEVEAVEAVNVTGSTAAVATAATIVPATLTFAKYVGSIREQLCMSNLALTAELGMGLTTFKNLLSEDNQRRKRYGMRDIAQVKALLSFFTRQGAISSLAELDQLISLAYPDPIQHRLATLQMHLQKEEWYAGLAQKSISKSSYQTKYPLANPSNPAAHAAAHAPVLRPLPLPPPLALPALPLTRLYGRQQELANCRRLLSANKARLVSIVGTGGVGKTRLVLELATELKKGNHYRDGVGFLSLETVTTVPELAEKLLQLVELEPDDIPASHEATEVREREAKWGWGWGWGWVARYFSTKEMLVVLDNTEQLVGREFAQFVTELLALSQGLQILVTSRERLNHNCEQVVRLAPLELPPLDIDMNMDMDIELDVDVAHLRLEALLTYPAVAMFTEQVQILDASFNLTRDNASSIVALCRKLSGLPLALEQAALRLAYFSPEVILEMLTTKLAATGTGTGVVNINYTSSRTNSNWLQPARHASLAANLAWSLDALSEAEKQLFSQLLTFEGIFTGDDVTRLTGKSLMALLNSFGGLLDKSLVQMIGVGTSQYRILDVIRLTVFNSALDLLDAAGSRTNKNKNKNKNKNRNRNRNRNRKRIVRARLGQVGTAGRPAAPPKMGRVVVRSQLTDADKLAIEREEHRQAFRGKVKLYCNSVSITLANVANHMNLPFSTLRYWLDGGHAGKRFNPLRNQENLKLVIAALTELEAINSLEEAEELLALAFWEFPRCQKFNTKDAKGEWYKKLQLNSMDFARGDATPYLLSPP